MERILLKLGVPFTDVTYRIENTPTLSGPMVLDTVTILPHPRYLTSREKSTTTSHTL